MDVLLRIIRGITLQATQPFSFFFSLLLTGKRLGVLPTFTAPRTHLNDPVHRRNVQATGSNICAQEYAAVSLQASSKL
jgi:hypothetical protein